MSEVRDVGADSWSAAVGRSWCSLLTASAVGAGLVLSGCANLSSGEKAAVGALVVGTAIASQIPSTDIEQVYYLGVFDPQEQLPPTMYRVRVRGQSSMLNFTKFASGWVRADLVDSLSTIAHAGNGGGFEIKRADEETKALKTGRRLVMFGPEGFREAPKDHRLVVVMGANPQAFFSAIDEALGVVASATQGRGGFDLQRALFNDLAELRMQRDRLEDLRTEAGGK
ncbi:MAG: hypothetical protein HY322_00750 [Betaproteobacteria bacterium]|nr:hypothetical protein [Betaproteobacteria bacterium]